MNVIGPNWWYVNIGSGNGLVPDGTKPLPEPILDYYLNQCWPRSMLPYGVFGPQWVKITMRALLCLYMYTLQLLNKLADVHASS